MNSGIADVVPLVASEKKVDAWVVSSLREKVYDDWIVSPATRCRISRISARYHESPSLLLSSIVPNAVFCRGVPTGMNSVPSACQTCTRGFSRSHCTGRIVLPMPREKSGFGNDGLAMMNRGVAGGFVTVTIR